MIIQATKRNTIIVAILASLVILAATINLAEFKWMDEEIKDFIEGFIVGICLVFIATWVIALIKKDKSKDVESKELNKVYLTIGMLSLVTGTIIQRFTSWNEWGQYLAVILFVSSIIFNLLYIVGLRKVRNR